VASSVTNRESKRGYWSGGGSTLVTAASRGDLELVRRCLLGRTNREGQANGGDPGPLLLDVGDSGPFCGPSPLSAAASAGHLAVVKFLVLECGADPDALDGGGLTPFQRAALTFNYPVIDFLAVEGGADVTKPVKLLYSSNKEHLTVLRLLDRFVGFDPVKPLLIKLGCLPLDLCRPLSSSPSDGANQQSIHKEQAISSLSLTSASAVTGLSRPYPAGSPAGQVATAIRERAWERRRHLIIDRHLTREEWKKQLEQRQQKEQKDEATTSPNA
jgi:Ankyrin repeats (many copies)